MDVREKLVELLDEAEEWADHKCDELDCETCYAGKMKGNCVQKLMVDRLIAHGVTVQECARPIEEWGEDYGDVLWWKFPIEEPPYVGSPLDMEWPAYHTHWTPIAMPQPPKGE